MKIKFFFIFILIILSRLSIAQKDFKPGFIVNNSGDTIFGEIDYRSDYIMSKVCTFKSSDNIITKYYPETIQAYRFIDGKYYVSRKINANYYFVEYLINGIIDIFYMKNDEGNHYFLENDSIPITEIPYEENIVYVDNKTVLYQSKAHTRILKYIMKDAPEIQSKIDNIKKPEHENLISIAQHYHELVCEGEECIVYEKKLPIVKFSLAPFYGITKYDISDNKLDNEIGSNVFLMLPRANERILFKLGLSFMKITSEKEEVTTIRYPFQVAYIYPAYRLKPIFGVGYCLNSYRYSTYKDYLQTINLDLGLHFEINNSVGLVSGYTIDFSGLSTGSFRGPIVSSTLHIGLYINL